MQRHPYDAPVHPRLWRSRSNKALAGVLGGLAERLDVNAKMLRWVFATCTFFSGMIPGLAIYIILWAVLTEHDIPRRSWYGPGT